jgi:hypothetical protein
MWLYPVPIGIGPERDEGACNRELPRILLFFSTQFVNKGIKRAEDNYSALFFATRLKASMRTLLGVTLLSKTVGGCDITPILA